MERNTFPQAFTPQQTRKTHFRAQGCGTICGLPFAEVDPINRRQCAGCGARGWAGWFSEAVHIILPALRNVLFIITLILVVWALNSLIAIWILTQGGPAGATSTMPIYIYSAFRDFNLSAASAASCLLLAVSLVFAGIYVLRKEG